MVQLDFGGGSADDWKRWEAVDVVSALLPGENSLEMGGGPGGGGQQIHPDGREADDGKRLPCDGRCIGVASRREVVMQGRSLRRGG